MQQLNPAQSNASADKVIFLPDTLLAHLSWRRNILYYRGNQDFAQIESQNLY